MTIKPKPEDPARRIGELEDEIKHRDRRIEELRQEIDEQRDRIRRFEEHAEDYCACMESWAEAFGMEMTDSGGWTWKPFWDEHNKLVDDYNDLVRDWNKYLPLINRETNPVGRPLGATEAQVDEVIKLRKRGMSLRAIADEVEIGLNTVRTIVDRANGTDRATRRRWERVHPGEQWQGRSYQPISRIDIRAEIIKHKRQKRSGATLPRQERSAHFRDCLPALRRLV
jgi:hypothetical protein